MYREYQPCGLLAPYVDKIWEFKGSPEYGMRINVLPDGCTDLIFALGGITQPVGNEGRIMPSCRSFFVGPMKRYSELVAYTETVHMVGIRFHPCGLFRFMDLPVQELGGQRISSVDLGIKLFDDSFTERLYELPDLRSRIQCIETVLVRSMHKHDVVDKQIVFAVTTFICTTVSGRSVCWQKMPVCVNGIWNGGSSCLPDLPLKNTVGL